MPDAAPTADRPYLLDRSDRHRRRIEGPDRAKFLHNLTTNEVKRLAFGRGCEAFITSPQGKTLGFVTLHNLGEALLLRADAGSESSFGPHLDKYGIFDDIAQRDVSADTGELHVYGPGADALLQADGLHIPGPEDGSHVGDADVTPLVIRERPFGMDGLTVIASRIHIENLRGNLAGKTQPVDDATAEAQRIAAGTPLFGRDLGSENLPQELDRDARAISFVKGCYLGQETVARIDALGHVNKKLRGLRFEGGSPPVGAELQLDGKSVGRVTSTARHATLGPIGLGIVRASAWNAGTTLDAAGIRAVVVDCPIRA